VKAVININRHVIAHNRKTGQQQPPITVKAGRNNVYCSEVVVTGTVRIIYQPDDPLKCGATAWLEVDGEVQYLGEVMTHSVLMQQCKGV
jgi:hypothetical protein